MVAHLRATRQRVIPELAERSTALSTGGRRCCRRRSASSRRGRWRRRRASTCGSARRAAGIRARNKVTIQLTGIPGGLPASNLTNDAADHQPRLPRRVERAALVLMSQTFTSPMHFALQFSAHLLRSGDGVFPAELLSGRGARAIPGSTAIAPRRSSPGHSSASRGRCAVYPELTAVIRRRCITRR